MKLFKDLYQYRELLKTNIQKEIRGKYKGAWLGVVWSYLNPLLMLVVYSVVFSKIMKIQIPNYTMFLFTALIPWTFFTQTVSQGAFSVVANGSILKKVYFPREIIPISIVTSNVITFLISCIIMLFFIFVTGLGVSWYILLFPVVLISQYVLLLGITFILSSVTVYIRDLEHIITVLLMVMFYGTPIVYSMDMVPASMKAILLLNPMTPIINSYRDILFYKQMPNLKDLALIIIVAIVLFNIGLVIFRKLERNFAEEL
ncbi:MAG: ABC transporter permease [Mollicutes bacterium]|nr:ABC transporter permease [Mollicutes bacterium]